MDFYTIRMKDGVKKEDPPILYADFKVGRSKDLMIRGKHFYAIWDEKVGLWSKDEYDVQRLVDEALDARADELLRETGIRYDVKHLRSAASGSWYGFRKYLQNLSDNSHDLDDNLTFSNTEVKKEHYASRRLPYPLVEGDCPAWHELVGTLYSVEERAKIEWFIGAIVSGDSKKIQKFGVFYGDPGTGKSTIMNIMELLFVGYTTSFDAKALGSANAAFSTEVFKDNPLVALQQDGDLSRIDDNTKLNSIIAHEPLTMNEKYKPSYTGFVKALLFMGTNQPVKISDAKSGIIRRLVDIHPTGVKIPTAHYFALMGKIEFELGAIAHHCLKVYQSMGKNYYEGYKPLEMMLQTDVFFNFVESHYDMFRDNDGTSLQAAYTLYKEWAARTGIEKTKPMYQIRTELQAYFETFKDRHVLSDGTTIRSYYSGFKASRFKEPVKNELSYTLVVEETESLLDEMLAEMPAQYATPEGIPKQRWGKVTTTLKDIATNEVHFVKVPEGHIVIDFDLRDNEGNKSLDRNLEAASSWPATYAEISKGGGGVHLHYLYEGDTAELNPIYSEGIEVKVYRGDSSLRRRVTRCNHVEVSKMMPGRLPTKEKKSMIAESTIKSEMGLRALIARCLAKEFGATKPSVDFIKKILDEAYEDGLTYDLSDMRSTIYAFANNSNNQSLLAIKTVQQMKFQGKDEPTSVNPEPTSGEGHTGAAFFKHTEDALVFFDVEVFPNLIKIGWGYEDESAPIVIMTNPTPQQVEFLLKMKLVGFNCRRYDNHILWALMMGYSISEVYAISRAIVVERNRNRMFGEAYNASYADIYDFTTKKQSLKMYEIELGIHHMELDMPWDQPVPKERWPEVDDYLRNDVVATRATFKARKADYVARQILAELSGLTVNHTTANHTAKIIFGNDRDYKAQFKYTDLSERFPGYKFDMGVSSYRGEDPSEGGYVYAEPGMYEDVVVLDVASMHPTSMIELNLFGDYTDKFADLLNARLAIKHGDYPAAREMLNGRLAPFLDDEADSKALSDALKIVINSVYGLTSAKFDNPFKDLRNIDNIVAKRGALFMIDLKKACQERGMTVVHIKTDSIKLVGASEEDIDFVMRFGDEYGYTFEHENTFERFCLVNEAVYIAREDGKWSATGKQFAHPYVFKTLFSEETVAVEDLFETKQVQKGTMYLDFDAVQKPMHSYVGKIHVGRTGRFLPITQETGGGLLLVLRDDKYAAVSGTKGYFWMEADMVESGITEDRYEIDMSYFEALADDAIKTINKFGDFEKFVK